MTEFNLNQIGKEDKKEDEKNIKKQYFNYRINRDYKEKVEELIYHLTAKHKKIITHKEVVEKSIDLFYSKEFKK